MILPMTEPRTKQSIFTYGLTRVLDVPFWALHALIPVILYKDLGATPFQVGLLVALKPLLSLLSMYWSSHVGNRPDRLMGNIRLARLFAYLPFFVFPFITTPWFFIFAYGTYMMLQVGTVPAWMEILKRNVPKEQREKTFSYIQAFCYMGGGFLPFLIGGLMDSYTEAWRWLFPVAALIGLSSDFIQRKIPKERVVSPEEKKRITDHLAKPWKEAFRILKERPDFTRYQIGFMGVGAGLMVIQPALPVFFTDILKLSYTELSVAITLAKGFGFAIASPWWGKKLNRADIFNLSGAIACFAALFPCLLYFAEMHLVWLYTAYFFYGIAQAGQELAWNMSGPIFSKEEDSSLYTSINVMAIGLRGAVIPLMGSILVTSLSSTFPLGVGSLLCLMGGLTLYSYRQKSIVKT